MSASASPLAWTYEAVESLRDIYSHIALDRPRTAQRTIASIVNKVASLAAAPLSGQRYPYSEGEEIFLLTYGHFRIAYCVRAAEGRGDESASGEPTSPSEQNLSNEPGSAASPAARARVVVLGVFHGLIFLPKR